VGGHGGGFRQRPRCQLRERGETPLEPERAALRYCRAAVAVPEGTLSGNDCLRTVDDHVRILGHLVDGSVEAGRRDGDSSLR